METLQDLSELSIEEVTGWLKAVDLLQSQSPSVANSSSWRSSDSPTRRRGRRGRLWAR
jgi:hypothetical protein